MTDRFERTGIGDSRTADSLAEARVAARSVFKGVGALDSQKFQKHVFEIAVGPKGLHSVTISQLFV